MIRASVLYPASDGSTFDHDYYRDTHIPLCHQVIKPVRAEVDKGVNGPYMAAVHFFFDSMEDFQAGMSAPDIGDVMADVANYTNVQPVVQVAEVVE